MSESLAARVGRIVSGGLNALVDAVEGQAPEAVMEQAIREIDSVIADARLELGGVSANLHLATRRHAEESNKLESLREKAEIAIESGRDDLATAAIEESLSIEDQVPVLAERMMDLRTQSEKIEGYIRALQSKKREMRSELKAFRESRAAAANSGADGAAAGVVNQAERENAAEQATSAFDRVLERQTGLSGVGATDGQRAAALDELDNLAHENRVQARLAALKAQRQG
ncbi:MAG: PspA/IM30 family protein [Pseudomonadota bacterium]|nr:PspA/IM30 family protein [Pseudomonadota bacterium]